MVSDASPAYLQLLDNGELERRAAMAWARLAACDLCPWKCAINRLEGRTGVCQAAKDAQVARFGPHFGEESALRGTNGSGAVFFSRCPQRCIFCQAAAISQTNAGTSLTAPELAAIFLELQAQNCHNINLVTPTQYIPAILSALLIAARAGLRLPLVYNSGGFERVETLRLLDGIIDIYLPDMKFNDSHTARQLSGCKDYVSANQATVLEMQRQVGSLVLDENGLARRGLIVRHLVLPNRLAGTRGVMQFLSGEVSSATALSLQVDYQPAYKSAAVAALNRPTTPTEIQQARAEAQAAGLQNLLD